MLHELEIYDFEMGVAHLILDWLGKKFKIPIHNLMFLMAQDLQSRQHFSCLWDKGKTILWWPFWIWRWWWHGGLKLKIWLALNKFYHCTKLEVSIFTSLWDIGKTIFWQPFWIWNWCHLVPKLKMLLALSKFYHCRPHCTKLKVSNFNNLCDIGKTIFWWTFQIWRWRCLGQNWKFISP